MTKNTVVKHAVSSEDAAAAAKMKAQAAPGKGHIAGPESRPIFDEIMQHTPPALGVTYDAATVGDIAGWWCRPPDVNSKSVILYLHGGAFIFGSAKAYRPFAGQIAARTKLPVFVSEYRLAPEHPFPAGVDDAVSVYAGLVKLGFSSIVLVGDSAGGSLALNVLAQASRAGGVTPRGAVALSPWVDLTLTGPSMTSRAEAEPYFTKAGLERSVKLYIGERDPKDPKISPLYGDLSGLPPVLIHVGGDEVLLSDSLEYGQRMNAAGGDCTVHEWEGLPHVFPSNLGIIGAAEQALASVSEFIRSNVSADSV